MSPRIPVIYIYLKKVCTAHFLQCWNDKSVVHLTWDLLFSKYIFYNLKTNSKLIFLQKRHQLGDLSRIRKRVERPRQKQEREARRILQLLPEVRRRAPAEQHAQRCGRILRKRATIFGRLSRKLEGLYGKGRSDDVDTQIVGRHFYQDFVGARRIVDIRFEGKQFIRQVK